MISSYLLATTCTKRFIPITTARLISPSFSPFSTTASNDNDDFGNEQKPIPPTLYRSDLVEIISKEHDVSKAKAERVVRNVFEVISEALMNDQSVNISGFGKFYSVTSASKMVRLFGGSFIKIKSSQRPKFRPSRVLKRIIEKKKESGS